MRQIARRCPRPCPGAPPACVAGASRTSRSSSTAEQSLLTRRLQPVAVLDAVIGRVRRPHVDVPLVADDAALQLDHAGRAQQVAAGRIAVVAALAHRHVEAQRDRVGEGQLHLAVIAARAEDAQVRDHAVPRADDRHRLLGREEAVLVERLVRRQLMALAEQPFQVFLA